LEEEDHAHDYWSVGRFSAAASDYKAAGTEWQKGLVGGSKNNQQLGKGYQMRLNGSIELSGNSAA